MSKIFKKLLLVLFYFSFCFNSNAQTLNNFSLKDIGQSVLMTTDGNGKSINMGIEMENYGSPFFDTDFLPASIVLANGQQYQNIQVKINLLSNEVIFKNEDGKELAILPAIQSVRLKKNDTDFLFEFGYPVFERQNTKTIYQVLKKGEISLLKYYFVQVTEAKPYSSATMLRTIEKFPKLFLYNKSNGIQKAPKSNEDFIAMFPSYSNQLQKILQDKKLKIKKEEDFIQCLDLLKLD